MFVCLVMLLVLAPFPVGSVPDWAWKLEGGVAGGLLALWTVTRLRPAAAVPVALGPMLPFAVPFALLVAWIWLQTVPGLLPALQHPVWAEAGRVLGLDLAPTLSIDPTRSRIWLIRILLYGVVFFLALQMARDVKRAQHLFWALGIGAALYACYGLANHFAGSRDILWYADTARYPGVTATFVHRGSFATYAGLCLLCVTGLIVKRVQDEEIRTAGFLDAIRAGIEFTFGRSWFLLVAWAVLVVAIFLSESRAGSLSTLAALVVLSLAIGLRQASRWRATALLLFAVLSAASIFFASSGGDLAERLGAQDPLSYRLRGYEAIVGAIEERPLAGTGLGTFADAFAVVKPPEQRNNWAQAHNSYLEGALELGLPGYGLELLVLLALGWRCLAGARDRRRDGVFPAVGLAATVLIAIEATVDISLQNAAVVMTYAAMMGVAVAQSWRTARR